MVSTARQRPINGPALVIKKDLANLTCNDGKENADIG